MTDPALSGCCSERIGMEPMICGGSMFAKVAVCMGCRGFKQRVEFMYRAPEDLIAAWKSDPGAYARMVDFYSGPRKYSPLWFRLENGRLYPKGMAVEEAA